MARSHFLWAVGFGMEALAFALMHAAACRAARPAGAALCAVSFLACAALAGSSAGDGLVAHGEVRRG